MAGKDAETAKNLLDVVDKTVITPKTDLGNETTFVLSKDGDSQSDTPAKNGDSQSDTPAAKAKPLVPQSPSDKPTSLRPQKKVFDAAGVSQVFLKPEETSRLKTKTLDISCTIQAYNLFQKPFVLFEPPQSLETKDFITFTDPNS